MYHDDLARNQFEEAFDFLDNALNKKTVKINTWNDHVYAYIHAVDSDIQTGNYNSRTINNDPNITIGIAYVNFLEQILRMEPMGGKKRSSSTYTAWVIAADRILEEVLMYDDEKMYTLVCNHIMNHLSEIPQTSRAWKRQTNGLTAQLYTIKTNKEVALSTNREPWLHLLQGLYNKQQPEDVCKKYKPSGVFMARSTVIKNTLKLWFNRYPKTSLDIKMLESWMPEKNSGSILNTYWDGYSKELSESLHKNPILSPAIINWTNVFFQKGYCDHRLVEIQVLYALQTLTGINANEYDCIRPLLKESFEHNLSSWLHSIQETGSSVGTRPNTVFKSGMYIELVKKLHPDRFDIMQSLDMPYDDRNQESVLQYWNTFMALCKKEQRPELQIDFLPEM